MKPPCHRRGVPPLSLFLKTGGSLLLTTLLLALVELCAGVLVPPRVPHENPIDVVAHSVESLDLNPTPQEPDVDLLWRNLPSARRTQPVNPRAFGRDDEWTIEINSIGFRGPELAAPVAGETFRILCIGDSVTFGFSVDQPDTYPQQLADLLAMRYPARLFEVVNAGVPGWSWLQGLRFLELRGMALDPDLIVIGHGTNDQFFNTTVTDEEHLMSLDRPVARAMNRLAVFAAETNIYRAFSRDRPDRPADEPSPGCREQIRDTGKCLRVPVDRIAAAVHETAALAADRSVDLLVVNTDFLQTPSIQGVRRTVESDRIPFVDLVGKLSERRRAEEEARAGRLGLAPVWPPPRPATNTLEVKQVVLRVLVPDRARSYRTIGTALYNADFSFAEPLYDDGTHGDERAGDAVFSSVIHLPGTVEALSYQFYQGNIAEFTAIPPYTTTVGNRVLQAPVSRIGPVEVFGQSLFMVERAHPNRDGHREIARRIADKFETLPAFRRFATDTGTLPVGATHR